MSLRDMLSTAGYISLTTAMIMLSYASIKTATSGSSLINKMLMHVLVAPNESRLPNVSDIDVVIDDDKSAIILGTVMYNYDTYRCDGIIRTMTFLHDGKYEIKDSATNTTIGYAMVLNKAVVKTSFYLRNFKGMTPWKIGGKT